MASDMLEEYEYYQNFSSRLKLFSLCIYIMFIFMYPKNSLNDWF